MNLTPRCSCLLALLLLLPACHSDPEHPADDAPSAGPSSQRVAPDPTFMNVSFASLALAKGEASQAKLDVINRGQRPAGPFRVGVYAAPGHVLLGSVEVSSLPSGAPVHLALPFHAPAEAGSYTVGIEVDDLHQVNGNDRTNDASTPARLVVR